MQLLILWFLIITERFIVFSEEFTENKFFIDGKYYDEDRIGNKIIITKKITIIIAYLTLNINALRLLR